MSFFPRPASLPQARPPCPSADPLLLPPFASLAPSVDTHPLSLARPTWNTRNASPLSSRARPFSSWRSQPSVSPPRYDANGLESP